MSWRHTKAYRNWRDDVVQRDSACVICSSTEDLEAHHIKDGSHHPKSRFDVKNGVTLCGGKGGCHTQLHTNFKNSFREKTTEKDWNNFVALTTNMKKKMKRNTISIIQTM